MNAAHDKSLIIIFLGFVSLCFAVTVHAESRYSITDLDSITGTHATPVAINDHGQVLGEGLLPGGTAWHWLYSKGEITPLNTYFLTVFGGMNKHGQIAGGVPVGGVVSPAILDSRTGATTLLGSLPGIPPAFPDVNGFATSVNKHGQAVGSSNGRPFLYNKGVMTDIGSLGVVGYARAINESGTVVVGWFQNSTSGYQHPFVYSNGVMTEINPFGGPNNAGDAGAVNDKGQVVGFAVNANGVTLSGYMYSDGLIVDMGILDGGHESIPFAINETGQVVGASERLLGYVPCRSGTCPKYGIRAFLYEDGVLKDLNSLIPANSGWTLEWAYDINNLGQIVGLGLYEGAHRGYLLTPAH